jgi:hypothetical protein
MKKNVFQAQQMQQIKDYDPEIPKERKPDVHVSIDHLDASINRLSARVGMLIDRLSPALKNGGRVADDRSTSNMEGSCAFSASLFALAERVESIDNSITNLLDNLEI